MANRTLLQDLESLFCPPLDPALFSAVVSDFDLAKPEDIRHLREILDTLKTLADEQQDLPFDPSGTSGAGSADFDDTDATLSEQVASQTETSRSPETDTTSLQSDFSSLDIGRNQRRRINVSKFSPNHTAWDNEDAIGLLALLGMREEEKMAYLAGMFPFMDIYTINHTFMKCDKDLDRSMDVLLNLSFFEEQSSGDDNNRILIPKGIDGFAGELHGGGGKRKGKRRRKTNRTLHPSRLDSAAPPREEDPIANKWDAMKEDVEFICCRTFPILQRETVASAYHSQGASLPATIKYLATLNAPRSMQEILNRPILAAQVAELTQNFATVSLTDLAGLLRITRSSISAANELATAMLRVPPRLNVSEAIQITIPAPAPASAPAVDFNVKKPVSRTARPKSDTDYNSASSTASSHFIAGAEAFSKASAAYRRGKSDPLMGAVAAYYSTVGRNHIEKAREEAAAAADALVDSQSMSEVLDLHGVTVQEAVRIASGRVTRWWESLGDSKRIFNKGPARNGYRIITGVGRHSRDRMPRIGPAVGKQLAREGWKVEVGQGVLTVTGVTRRR
ncbi:hypothetical protein Egran_05880 [Elaphomyces granulatus]|uniref:Smr domain-containing protein n=1 Tax=Elaphomyces granulatus TaxID=519963 RepID=A0A232LQF0_9EURO|nr:hypothetical protein Egran_05880 [Elaphomyces granulatus]